MKDLGYLVSVGETVSRSSRAMINSGGVTMCLLLAASLSIVYCEKYRICVVDGRGHFKKSYRYCPDLDKAPDSKVECIVAPDRTDCLRKILKETADFSVFTPEDLVTASNEGVQLLVTNELRFLNSDENEYEVVAVIENTSGITSRHDLKGKRYCHPGYGYLNDWTRILSNFFEASVVTPSCETKLTLTENRIKATAEFFKSACKAGPWVENPLLDYQLKQKYPSLCELCGNPASCSTHDEYWGRRGSLLCLTDGAGDVSWARLDDVKQHFGLVSGNAEVSSERYSFLCPDDTIRPLNSSTPCVWVVKPWPVIASSRTKADEVQKIISSLGHKERDGWRSSLLNLIENSYSTFYETPSVEPIESYLDRAEGFLSANSFSGCHPPRTIRICTSSIIETAKCSWLRESAAVYGIEPDLDCIKADNTSHCMLALNMGAADIVMVPSDLTYTASKKYDLKTLFYETTLNTEKYLTVAVTRPGSGITSFQDLRGKKACFPSYDGVAWNTVKENFLAKGLIESCPLDEEMAKFFGPSCTPGFPGKLGGQTMTKNCQGDTFNGEFGALHCLSSEVGDVAFVSKNSIRKFVADESEGNPGSRLSVKDFEILCEGDSKSCHLSWATLGQAMVRGNSSDRWMKDTLDVFLQLDQLFGKNYQSLTTPFTMYGRYDGQPNLLFHDETQNIRDVPFMKNTDKMPKFFNNTFHVDERCKKSSTTMKKSSQFFVISLILFYHFV